MEDMNCCICESHMFSYHPGQRPDGIFSCNFCRIKHPQEIIKKTMAYNKQKKKLMEEYSKILEIKH